MEISRYLAMTPAEMAAFPLPQGYRPAYMACHFALGNLGLSNIPQALPQGCLLTVNDQNPISGHDPELILSQLIQVTKGFGCSGVLLDFERELNPETEALCRVLTEGLDVPVGVSATHDAGICPVFLPPCPQDVPIKEYLAPWKGREVWLDGAMDLLTLELTETGCVPLLHPWTPAPENAFTDETLHCRYRVEILEDRVRFRLWRDRQQLENLVK